MKAKFNNGATCGEGGLINRQNNADQMIAGAAHELNNKLQIITGYAELGKAQINNTNAVRESFNEIELTVQRSVSMLKQLSVQSQINEYEGTDRTDRTGSIDLNKSLTLLQPTIEAVLHSGINIAFELSTDLPRISASSSQLLQAVINLVLHVQASMLSSGTITLETSRFNNLGLVKKCADENECIESSEQYVQLRIISNGRSANVVLELPIATDTIADTQC